MAGMGPNQMALQRAMDTIGSPDMYGPAAVRMARDQLPSLRSMADYETAKDAGEPWALATRDHSLGAQLKALAKGAGVLAGGFGLINGVMSLPGNLATTAGFGGASAPAGAGAVAGGVGDAATTGLFDAMDTVGGFGDLGGGATSLGGAASSGGSLLSDFFADGTLDTGVGALEAATKGGGGEEGNLFEQLFSGLFGGGGGGAGSAGSLLSLLSKGLDIGTGIYGISKAKDLQNLASSVQERADPFGPYRAGYAEQLKRLSENPSTITQTPGWDAGIQAVQRSAAGRGYLNSGNEISALQNFGGDFFNRESNRLARLAGADFAPGTGGQLALQGNEAALNLLAQALSRISAGVGSFGGP